jgi:hypothetical protein
LSHTGCPLHVRAPFFASDTLVRSRSSRGIAWKFQNSLD